MELLNEILAKISEESPNDVFNNVMPQIKKGLGELSAEDQQALCADLLEAFVYTHCCWNIQMTEDGSHVNGIINRIEGFGINVDAMLTGQKQKDGQTVTYHNYGQVLNCRVLFQLKPIFEKHMIDVPEEPEPQEASE